jgi:ABC-type nickel/cobalt efflux system permease component RcnA
LRRWLLGLIAGALALLILAATAPAASAHPLGNFTINTYNGVRIEPQAVAVRMIVDYAEIPTVQRFPAAGEAGDVSAPQADHYAATHCDRLVEGARLRIDRVTVALATQTSTLVFVPGAGGLDTMRLTCELRTADPVDTAGTLIEYVDENSLERLGWREITAVGDGVDLAASDVPARSVSQEMTAYPDDLLSSPLDQRTATIRAVAGTGKVTGATAASGPQSQSAAEPTGLTTAFTDLVAARDLSSGFAVFALAMSIAFGALHAFAPGHGKTLMAAYMLGQQRSSLRQVAVIGLTVTLTHTAGVLALGLVLSTVALAAPDQIYSWLGLTSGVLLVAIGVSLLRQAQRRPAPAVQQVRASALVAAPSVTTQEGHGHDHHAHGHGQPHRHDHDHGHGHDQHAGITHRHGFGGTHTHAPPSTATSARSLIAVGFIGGMVPAPSALIVLLAGIALGRAWFGVLLVLGYGIGMALALTGTGVALAYSRDRIEAWASSRRTDMRSAWALKLGRALPTVTASLVMIVGVGLILRAAATWTA